jgi:hypothetical protein
MSKPLKWWRNQNNEVVVDCGKYLVVYPEISALPDETIDLVIESEMNDRKRYPTEYKSRKQF